MHKVPVTESTTEDLVVIYEQGKPRPIKAQIRHNVNCTERIFLKMDGLPEVSFIAFDIVYAIMKVIFDRQSNDGKDCNEQHK